MGQEQVGGNQGRRDPETPKEGTGGKQCGVLAWAWGELGSILDQLRGRQVPCCAEFAGVCGADADCRPPARGGHTHARSMSQSQGPQSTLGKTAPCQPAG